MDRIKTWLALACAGLLAQTMTATSAPSLGQSFQNPTLQSSPAASQVGVFWFWANTVTKQGIRRDLEEMRRAGIRRVILGMTRAHGATVEQGGVVFLSPEWLALFRYALDEAERLGLKVSAVMSNGWYQGAPWVTPELGAQMLVWSESTIAGPAAFATNLPAPDQFRKGRRGGISPKAKGHFRPIAVLAFRQNDSGALLKDSLVRLDDLLQPDGTLAWSVPAGTWRVLRFAYAPNFVPMKQDSPGFTGLQIDHLSAPAMELFFSKVGVPMLQAAGRHVGKTLDYFHEDSVELGHFDWTADFPAQFAARRKYDLIPWLPVLAGKSFAGHPQARRVEHDFTSTVDELLADEHYGRFRELCHQHGLKLETEGGDVTGSLRVKGTTDLPMGEFWNLRPKKTDPRYVENSNNLRAFNPNAVIASRVYGSGCVSFEAFTTAQHWMEYPAMLKPMADEVYCLGVNHLTLHGYSYSRPETPRPGDVYFAGTHFDPGVTWWSYAGEFFSYLNRCQLMLNTGRPVVDLLYVDGPETQVMIQRNDSRALTTLGKCDVIPGELLTSQLKVLPDGRVGLANGAAYAVLSVANTTIEPQVLQTIVQRVNEGATVWFRTVPRRSSGFTGFPESDKTVASCLNELGADRPAGVYRVGQGKVILGDMAVKDMLVRIGLEPDFAYTPDDAQPFLDYAHRQLADTDIYFLANWKDAWHRAECAFRVPAKQPELWNPVTGQISPSPLYRLGDGLVRLSLQLPPNGSVFVVFRQKADGGRLESLAFNGKPLEQAGPVGSENIAALQTRPDGTVWLQTWKAGKFTLRKTDGGAQEITVAPLPEPRPLEGPWRIRFNPAREGMPPFDTSSPALFLWNESADPRIKAFAGTASYLTTFLIPHSALRTLRWSLDLGAVHDLAEILLNGKPAGVAWTPPFRVDLTPVLQPGTNTLEIRVVNTWHNWRLANKYSPVQHNWSARGLNEPPMPSGLLGPVTIRPAETGFVR
jgi:hypothetical protein